MNKFDIPDSVLKMAQRILEGQEIEEDPDESRTKRRKDKENPDPPEIVIDPEIPNMASPSGSEDETV